MPLDNMALAYKERCVVDSAGFLRGEQYFRETEAFNADCEEVFVLSELSAVDESFVAKF